MFALAGPTLEREFRKFASHTVGRSMLDEDPRRDLNALLGNRAALAGMSKGSFAHAYLEYLGGDQMGSSEYFLEAAGLDETIEMSREKSGSSATRPVRSRYCLFGCCCPTSWC
jgi:hypothetical protein